MCSGIQPPTLLSRFDLIYLVLDQPNPVADKRLAKHIVSLYFEHPPQAASTVLSIEEFAEVYYRCVVILLYMCPHTTIYVSSY